MRSEMLEIGDWGLGVMDGWMNGWLVGKGRR